MKSGDCIATIKDVAKHANVSLSTASYALKGDLRVSEKTRLVVMEAAKTLGFYPSSAARSLKTKRSNIIGVFIRGYAGPVFSIMLNGINTTLREHGYDMVSASGRTTVERFLRERIVDGAIVLDSFIESGIILETACERLPIVLLDRELEGNYVHSLLLNNEELFAGVVEILIEKGCKNIIYMSGANDSYDNIHRHYGYSKAMRAHGLSEIVYNANFTIDSGYRCMMRILDDKASFDAVACGNDEMAIGAMEALREKGYRIPGDKLVTGFDNIDLAKFYHPSLTTVAIDRATWGAKAAERLVYMITDGKTEQRIAVGGEIIHRESTRG